MDCPWRSIAIEGVIGAGKTSLARMLAEEIGADLDLEVVEENPFLSRFYEDRRSHAFVTQMFFLLSRYRQQMARTQMDLFGPRVVADYLFAKDRIFANITLDEDELRLYERIADVLDEKIPRPEVVVYLQASTEVLLRRIAWRGRAFERNMDPEYIQTLNEAYNYFFFHYTETPLLVVNTNDLDFVRNRRHYEDLRNNIVEPFTGTRYYAPSWS
ncbi:MAG TPA: deoxynucleoside kinase [Candidatus Krumholzibacteria bacterium]|nr:deoxynucleoside kinase [Candidatus Krumholzibacteria bacterium]